MGAGDHALPESNRSQVSSRQGCKIPVNACASCPLCARCTTSKTGRSVSIHPDEQLLQELRQRQATVVGRARLRQRVAVEHTLAHISQWQGHQALSLGLRKNLFDLRRMAVVYNLHVLARMPEPVVESVEKATCFHD